MTLEIPTFSSALFKIYLPTLMTPELESLLETFFLIESYFRPKLKFQENFSKKTRDDSLI